MEQVDGEEKVQVELMMKVVELVVAVLVWAARPAEQGKQTRPASDGPR